MSGEGLPPNKMIAMLIAINLFIVLFWTIKTIIFFIKKDGITDGYGHKFTYFEYVFWNDDIGWGNLFACLTFALINGIAIIIASAEYISKFIS